MKIISPKEHVQFLNSLTSITSKLNKDLIKLDKLKFLKIYGHLRPNTYEINSKNYKDNYNFYFAKKVRKYSFRTKSLTLISKPKIKFQNI